MEDYSEYTDDMLLNLMKENHDMDEVIFEILPELGIRKHPKTKELCLTILNRNLYLNEYIFSSVLYTLYDYDEDVVLNYAKDHYNEFHIYCIGTLISLLWVDSERENSKNKINFIKKIKDHLATLSKNEISVIQENYDEFMKSYKYV